eukprot:5209827-Prymnesium_polylepis.1
MVDAPWPPLARSSQRANRNPSGFYTIYSHSPYVVNPYVTECGMRARTGAGPTGIGKVHGLSVSLEASALWGAGARRDVKR